MNVCRTAGGAGWETLHRRAVGGRDGPWSELQFKPQPQYQSRLSPVSGGSAVASSPGQRLPCSAYRVWFSSVA